MLWTTKVRSANYPYLRQSPFEMFDPFILLEAIFIVHIEQPEQVLQEGLKSKNKITVSRIVNHSFRAHMSH